MKCPICKQEYEEKDMQLSHDVPRWMDGKDEDGRHWLCKECHRLYEWKVILTVWANIDDKEEFRNQIKLLARQVFGDGNSTTT